MDGSLGGKKKERKKAPETFRRREGTGESRQQRRASGQERCGGSLPPPRCSQLRKPKQPSRALPNDPPRVEPWRSWDQYLPPAPALAALAPGLWAQGIPRRRARHSGAHRPRQARRLMLHRKPKARAPRRRRDLARVKRVSPERRVRAAPRPDAPPSLPASCARPARPARCGGRFPGTFQEFAPRDRGPRYRFQKAAALLRRLRGGGLRRARVRSWAPWPPASPPSSDLETRGTSPRRPPSTLPIRAGVAPGSSE